MNTKNQLIHAIANGDKKAFGSLYELHKDKVYNIALSYLQNVQEAEDVTQEVFLTIFRNAASFRGEATISTWIYRITINTSLNLLKRKQRYKHLKMGKEGKRSADFVHPGVLLDRKEDAKLLFAAIYVLSKNQKTAFILSFIEHLPRQEVANIMSLSLKAVEALLQRAKANLKKKLKKDLS